VELRPLSASEEQAAGELLASAWPAGVSDAAAGRAAVASARGGAIGAFSGGAMVGVALMRAVGDVAEMTALAAYPGGKGTGGALLDAACELADEWGAHAVRLRAPAGDPAALALCAARGFGVVDVAARLARPAAAPPRLDAARGLELGPARPSDLAALVELDRRLTGIERPRELERATLVARRRGSACGFLMKDGTRLGPALALDVADLGVLVARALADTPGAAHAAVLSTAAPSALLAAAALGFRVESVELVLVRGPAPPARPPQLY
jgi:GNAT superfamily N-acetyltransferase